MKKLEEMNIKIEANKEVLSTLPKNNAKNINAYIEKVNSLGEEFKEYKQEILKEIENRYKQATKTSLNPEIATIEQEINNSESVLYLLNNIKTSYEKMDFDKAMHDLRYYYKKNLEVVNGTIIYCIKKFKDIGITLRLEDFCYSKYVREYLTVFFEEMKKENIDYARIESKFKEIYWECPNIIIYIELNLRYLYLKNEKTIDNYYAKQKAKLLDKTTKEEILNRYFELKKQLIEKTSEDKHIIITDIIEENLNIKDFSNTAIREKYSKFISKDILENANENKLSEIDSNLKQLLNSIYEYRSYLKFKFIIEDVKKIYSQKDKYKDAFTRNKKTNSN